MSGQPLSDLQAIIGHSFQNSSLLMEALTHKSYLNEYKESLCKDNERLEFLGDAVLDLIISDYLIQHLPASHEGDLSKRKSKVVSESFLAAVAHKLGLGAYIRLGRGETLTGGRQKDSILADALEALIAGIYLDGGLEKVRSFILGSFELGEVIHSQSDEAGRDHKTALQELSQKKFDMLPVYKLIGETGPDHCKTFEVELWIKGELCGQGKGRSKKEAEQQAAKLALEYLEKVDT